MDSLTRETISKAEAEIAKASDADGTSAATFHADQAICYLLEAVLVRLEQILDELKKR